MLAAAKYITNAIISAEQQPLLLKSQYSVV